MEDLYSRSPLMGVSQPTNFVHQVHVGFDPISGGFTVSYQYISRLNKQGLPPQWSKLLTSSAITKEEAARNPEAVLDALQFYTHQMNGNVAEQTPQSIPSLPAPSRTTSTAAMRFEGVGLAGQPQHQHQERERERERLAQLQRDRDREEEYKKRDVEKERERQAARERERQREMDRAREEEQRSRSQSQASSSRHVQRPSETRPEIREVSLREGALS